jgi:hypothetical protein
MITSDIDLVSPAEMTRSFPETSPNPYVEISCDGNVSGRDADGLHAAGIRLLEHFHNIGELADIENAISNLQEAVKLTVDGDPNKPMYLSKLCTSLQTRYERLGTLADMENVISNKQMTVDLIDDTHPSKLDHLASLGSSQNMRFRRLALPSINSKNLVKMAGNLNTAPNRPADATSTADVI